MSRRIWKVRKPDLDKIDTLAPLCGDVFTAALFCSAGIDTPEKIEEFMSDDTELSDPFLIKDMDKAVAAINDALDADEKICVFGDYDADGVTATAVLMSYLESLGADVFPYIPSRLTEGYGLSPDAVDRLSELGVGLIITVDNGISALDAADRAAELGIKLVVTDHHTVGPVLPKAEAVVDPHREDDESPYHDYAGCGVALKLICAMEDGDDLIMENYADLVAVGTIADIVPLTGENRKIVRQGLININTSPRPGIEALFDGAGFKPEKMTSSSVSFTVAPRINAGGRMGDADTALALLLSEDRNDAAHHAAKLEECNNRRHEEENRILGAIAEMTKRDPSLLTRRFLVFAGEDWHPGVIGIVAARVTEKFGRPSCVISFEGGEGKGSCRSIEGFSVYDALSAVSDTLTHFGGHTQAAGLGLKKEMLGAFTEAVNEYAASHKTEPPVLQLSCRVNPSSLDVSMCDSIEKLEPFGAKNPVPVIGLYGMTVGDVIPLKNGKHIKIVLKKDSASVDVLKFNMSPDAFPYRMGDTVDAAVELSKNFYMGSYTLSAKLVDLRPAGADDRAVIGALEAFGDVMRGAGGADEKELCLPDRKLIESIYKHIRSQIKVRGDAEIIARRLDIPARDTGKVSAALEALTQTGLVTHEGAVYKINKNPQRVDLTQSAILRAVGYTG